MAGIPRYGHVADHVAAALALVAVLTFAFAWPSANVFLSVLAAVLMVAALTTITLRRHFHTVTRRPPAWAATSHWRKD
jgi:hypothetical protein